MNLDELIRKYMTQGHSYHDARGRAKRYQYNRKRYEEQRKVRDAVSALRMSDPKKYAELMYRATHEGEIEARERDEEKRRLDEEKRRLDERLFKFKHSLVSADIPDVVSLLAGVEGVVAFRTWNVTDGKLGSMATRSVWSSQMIADRIPTASNTSGLYCVKLDPLGLMTTVSYYLGEVCGLVELRGKVLEHADGVMRAEWARIICVFIQASENTGKIYHGLYCNYPTLRDAMYVLHREQIAGVLLRVTVMQTGGFGNDLTSRRY